MRPTTLTTGRLFLVLLTAGLTIGLISWDHKQSPDRIRQSLNDTTPEKKSPGGDKKIRDLDDVLDELNAADLKVNMEKIKEEIGEAMKKIDGDKIKAQLDMALKEVDMAKIQKELQESLAKVDLDQVKKQMNEAMKNVDMAKIQQELQESMSKVKWDEIKAEMDKVKNIDMKKIDEEMKKVKQEMNDLQPKLEKELGKAKVGLEKAKTTIAEFKGFVDGLEKDGLISKKEGYTLKHKEGELFINGKKASEQTYSKYRDFLEKHKKFSIEKSDDDFDIDMD
jgi:hypothetical protein